MNCQVSGRSNGPRARPDAHKGRNYRGMTLIEVLVAATILSMIGAALFAILVQSLRGWSKTASQDTATSRATIALQKLSNEIRDGRTASVSGGTLSVYFPLKLEDPNTHETIYDSSAVDTVPRRYYLDGDDLVRAYGNSVSVVARGIDTVEFLASGGTVTITHLNSTDEIGQYSASQDVSGRVTLRNYRN